MTANIQTHTHTEREKKDIIISKEKTTGTMCVVLLLLRDRFAAAHISGAIVK
jgi:hypothetical protein